MTGKAGLLAILLLAIAPVLAKAAHNKAREQTPRQVSAPAMPSPRPGVARAGTADPPMDLSQALPGKALAKLPPSAQQLKSLSTELKQQQPQLASAEQKSQTLAGQAAQLRQKLIATAGRIELLERRKLDDDAQLLRLAAQDQRLSAGFANDRVAVTKLLGVLERLQHDMPPALAMRPDDALAAARGAMLIGASLPSVYAQAARLSRRIDALKRTRLALQQQQGEAAKTEAGLTRARGELDELLARKENEAAGAAQAYGILKEQLQQIARQAADFEALLQRVKKLRQEGQASQASVVTVTAQNSGPPAGLDRNVLLEPVVGSVLGTTQTDANPGLSYATRPLAQVISPADGKVLYAGPYHKSGQVLILEITTGYDAVLAGLGRVTVKPNDQLLAGEPVGTMSADTADDRLYFELRHGGHGQSPAPWLKVNLRASFGKANGT